MTSGGGLAAIAIAVFVALIMVWGASSGDPVLAPPSSTFEFQTPSNRPPPTVPDFGLATQPPVETGEASSSSVSWWLIVQIAALLLLAYLAFRWLRKRSVRVVGTFVEPVDELEQLLEATAVDPQAPAFAGEPRNAVVACWVALEDGLTASGVVPERSETSLDLTVRVLTRWEVDPATLSTLAELYREARFSRHPITTAQRDAAVGALSEIHSTLRRAALRNEPPAEDPAADGAPSHSTSDPTKENS